MDLKLLDISSIEEDANQPRKHFDNEKLVELKESILESGLIYPIIVRKKADEDDKFIIVAGERRFRAISMIASDTANLEKSEKHKQIQSFIFEGDDYQTIALVENLQREDLTAVEQAEGIKALYEAKGGNQSELSKLTGKSESRVSELLKISKLPKDILNDARKRSDTPSWVLTEIAKIKDKQEQIEKWKELKDRKITRKVLRDEKAAALEGTVNQLNYTNVSRSIKILTTQVEKWNKLQELILSDSEKSTLEEELTKLFGKLRFFSDTFLQKSTPQ